MLKTIHLYILITLFSLPNSNIAFADHYHRHHSSITQIGIDFERISINPDTANRELIGKTATALNLSLKSNQRDSIKPYTDFEIGLSIVNYDDFGQFTQETIDDYGHLVYANSHASAMHAYIAGGPNIPINRYMNISFKGGYTLPISSDRSISNCLNCYSEDIDIDAGFYGQIGVNYNIDELSIRFGYKDYIDNNNGIEDSAFFGISIWH